VKIACYTALVGDYDNLLDPAYTTDEWDYICFTNQKISVSKWDIRPLQHIIAKDPTRTNRWHKLNPHILFPDYDYSIYIDANIQICGPHLETKVNDFCDRNILMSLPLHPFRNCTYKEINECILLKTDELTRIRSLVDIFHSDRFPYEMGLFENNVIFRKHMDEKIIDINKKWWELVRDYAKRDQLSLMYLLWKNKVPRVEPLLHDGHTIRSFIGYRYNEHNQVDSKPNIRKIGSKLIRLFIPIRSVRRRIRERLIHGRNLDTKIKKKWRSDIVQSKLTTNHKEHYFKIHRYHHQILDVFPAISDPTTFNDKIAWLMLFDQHEKMISHSDKYKVREYVYRKVGDQYLIILFGVYNCFSEINLSELPSSFVIKTNHDSGSVFLIKDKSKIDVKSLDEKFSLSLSKKYADEKGEWAYQHIQPRIIVEEYMDVSSDLPLVDYKFHCVNGKIRWLEYIFDRGNHTKVIVFDENFSRLDLHLNWDFQRSFVPIKKPKNWEECCQVAEKLAEGLKYVRVDLYNINNKIFFGEMTFWPLSGCYVSSDIQKFGSMMQFETDSTRDPYISKNLV